MSERDCLDEAIEGIFSRSLAYYYDALIQDIMSDMCDSLEDDWLSEFQNTLGL